jgi:hypothetical protein
MAHILPDSFGMMPMMHLRSPTGPDGGFNLKESFRCRFAAGEKILNHRLNLLLLVGSNPFFGSA